jgi:hypothetical protein
MGVAGLPTAFVARHRKNAGAPNLGVIVEYDALRDGIAVSSLSRRALTFVRP